MVANAPLALPETVTHKRVWYSAGKPNKLGCEGEIHMYDKWRDGDCVAAIRWSIGCILIKDPDVRFRVYNRHLVERCTESSGLKKTETEEGWWIYDAPATAHLIVHHNG